MNRIFFSLCLILWSVPLYQSRVLTLDDNSPLKKFLENKEPENEIKDDEESDDGAKKNPSNDVEGAIKKSKKNEIDDGLVLLEFPPDGKEKILTMVNKEMEGVFDKEMISKMAHGDFKSLPSTWSSLLRLDFKKAVFTIICKQFFSEYETVAIAAPVKGLTKKECKQKCKQTESGFTQFASKKIIQLFQSQLPNEDLRFDIRPGKKRNYKYEEKDGEFECSCINVGKKIYVSPRLAEIMNEKFFKTDAADQEFEEFMKNNPIDENNSPKGWYFNKLGNYVKSAMGYNQDLTRGNKGKDHPPAAYYWARAGAKAEFLIFQSLISFALLIICPPLWPIHLIICCIIYPFV